MKIASDRDLVTVSDDADARYPADAAIRTEAVRRAQATVEFDESELGWLRCGEAVLPIAAPLVALAIMLTILVA